MLIVAASNRLQNCNPLLIFYTQLGSRCTYLELCGAHVLNAFHSWRCGAWRSPLRGGRPRWLRMPSLHRVLRSTHQQMEPTGADEPKTWRRWRKSCLRWNHSWSSINPFLLLRAGGCGQWVPLRHGRTRLSRQQPHGLSHGDSGALRSGHRYLDTGNPHGLYSNDALLKLSLSPSLF